MKCHSWDPVRAFIRGLATCALASPAVVLGGAGGLLALACGSDGVDAAAGTDAERGGDAAGGTQLSPDMCEAELEASTPMPPSTSPPLPALPPSEQTLEIEGELFDLFSAGPRSGEVVLLLQGFPDASDDYGAALPRLALAGYRAITAIRRAPAALSDLERDREPEQRVRAIADALELDRFHVAGGQLAWDVARVVDERVLSVVRVAPTRGAGIPELERSREP